MIGDIRDWLSRHRWRRAIFAIAVTLCWVIPTEGQYPAGTLCASLALSAALNLRHCKSNCGDGAEIPTRRQRHEPSRCFKSRPTNVSYGSLR